MKKQSLAIALCLAAICPCTRAADRTPEQDDLYTHMDELTLVLVGRSEQKLPKVGDTPTFTKIFTGKQAFGTKNDRWFDSYGPSASDQQVDKNRMEKVIALLPEAGPLTKRSVLIPDPVTHRFEEETPDLPCAALAIGYVSNDQKIVYYLVKIDDRKKAVTLFQKMKEIMRAPQSSASAVVDNILWRLER
jgi:hypothetical protein